ncbi:hypothetical protein Dimus_033303, partial [Dionaea muscipula]
TLHYSSHHPVDSHQSHLSLDQVVHDHINRAVKCMLLKMDEQSKATQELLKYFEFHHPQEQKLKIDICVSIQKLTQQMRSVVKDVDTLTYAIQEKIPKSISTNTDYLEKKINEVEEDARNHFEMIEKKIQLIELDLNINFNRKIDKVKRIDLED